MVLADIVLLARQLGGSNVLRLSKLAYWVIATTGEQSAVDRHLIAHVLMHRDAPDLKAPCGRRRIIAALTQPPGEALLECHGARLA